MLYTLLFLQCIATGGVTRARLASSLFLDIIIMCCGLIIMLVWLVVCLHKLCVRVCVYVCVCMEGKDLHVTQQK